MEGTVAVFRTAAICAWVGFLPSFAFAASVCLLPCVQIALAFARNWGLVTAVVAVPPVLLLLLLLLPHPPAASPTITAAAIAAAVSRLGSGTFWFTAGRSGWSGWGIGLLWFLPGPCRRPNALRCPAACCRAELRIPPSCGQTHGVAPNS